MIRRLGLALVLMIGASSVMGAAEARALTEIERAELEAVTSAYAHALEASDADGMLAVLPPKLLDQMEKLGQLKEERRLAAAENFSPRYFGGGSKLIGAGPLLDVVFHFGAEDAFSETRDGLLYGRVSLAYTFEFTEWTGRIENQMIALREAGVWRLYPMGDIQQAVLLGVIYPSIDERSFDLFGPPRRRMRRVDQ